VNQGRIEGTTPGAGPLGADGTSRVTGNRDACVCDLDEPDFSKRRVDWATLAKHVRRKELTDNGLRIVYDTEVGEALRSLVDAERACCAWATWTRETTDEGHVMEVTARPELIGAIASALGV
jgi:hypothetical protein